VGIQLSAVLGIAKLMLIIIVCMHFVSCGWYWIGTLGNNGEGEGYDRRWVPENINDHVGLGYRYTTCFHWSLTQMTPASMEINPANALERFYTICIIFCGLLMFSSFISSMTQTMTELGRASGEHLRQDTLVQQYVNEHELSSELVSSILSFNRTRRRMQGVKKRLKQQDVATLSALPDRVLMQLHNEVYMPIIVAHPLFRKIENVDMVFVNAICHRVLSEMSVMNGELVFHLGQLAAKMYFPVAGVFGYAFGHLPTEGGRNLSELVPNDFWVSEASLWVVWCHHGALLGEAQSSDIIQVESGEFHTAASLTWCSDKLRTYAAFFAECMSDDISNGVEINDLWSTHDHVEALVKRVFLKNSKVKSALVQRFCTRTAENFMRKFLLAWHGIACANRKERFASRKIVRRLIRCFGRVMLSGGDDQRREDEPY